jgi:hypothetical protein
MPKLIDPRKIIPGHNGMIFDKDGMFLAQIPTFQAQVNFNNTDYQPAGSPLTMAIPTSVSITITCTETVVNDVPMFKKMMDGMRKGQYIPFTFQGNILSRDKTNMESITYRECVPDGAIDMQNIQPGEIISRAWSFRVNELPDMPSWLKDEE